jgi:phospholipid/cholesterol/gamma-HCH transport system substrate-binding protein
MTRSVLVQLVLFVVIAVVCGVLLVGDVVGPRGLAAPMRITVPMVDASGLTVDSDVTYRGVPVGKVAAVRVSQDGTGVSVALEIDPKQRIPVSSKAMISMDSPIAIQHLDLQPASDDPPYLADGDSLAAGSDTRPLPLDTLLTHAMDLVESIDVNDLAIVSEALATGLNGAGPQLRQILANTSNLASMLDAHRDDITNLVNLAPELVGSTSGAVGDLPELASSMRQLASQIRAHDPTIRRLLDAAPRTVDTLASTMSANQQAVNTLLGNLLITADVLSARTPALTELFTALPTGLGALASIVHGDFADFYFVVAQGPVCYYDTPRRLPTDTSPREPELGWHCPPDRNLSQRGAANAPRPTKGPTPAATGTDASPVTTGTSAVRGPSSWYSILLQGVR